MLLATLLYVGAILGFAAAINIGAIAIRKYTIANRLFEQTAGKKYGGPLPEHIWRTALGTVLLILAVAFYVFKGGVPDTVTIELVLSFGGFLFLAWGMWELLHFERGRVAAHGVPISLAERPKR